jgi:hypothetical protein
MTILSFIQPTEFNWDILRRGVELGDDATDEQVRLAETEDTLEERANLKKASRFAIILGGGIVLCIVVLWPMPMYGSRYIFSKQCNSLCQMVTHSSFHRMGCRRIHLVMDRCDLHYLLPSLGVESYLCTFVEADDWSV